LILSLFQQCNGVPGKSKRRKLKNKSKTTENKEINGKDDDERLWRANDMWVTRKGGEVMALGAM